MGALNFCKTRLMVLIVFLLFFSSCNGGSSGDSKKTDISPEKVEGKWYSHLEYQLGFRQIRFEFIVDANSFELYLQSFFDNKYKNRIGIKGDFTENESREDILEVREIGFADNSGSIVWFNSSAQEFEEVLKGMWGGKLDHVVAFSLSDSVLTAEIDMNADGDYKDEYETLTFSKNENSDFSGGGKYPAVDYSSIGFHSDTSTAALTMGVEMDFPELTTTDISIFADLTNINGDQKVDIALAYNAEREEWINHNYDMGSDTPEGLWWVSRIKAVNNTDNSSIEMVCDSPYKKYFTAEITTSDQTKGENIKVDMKVGQDYAWDDQKTLYYIETFENASQDIIPDPVVKLFNENDTEKWIAFNDDGGRDALGAGLRYPLESGKTYYLAIEDYHEKGGAYSIKISSDFNGSSINRPANPDKYEPDDSPDKASVIVPDEV